MKTASDIINCAHSDEFTAYFNSDIVPVLKEVKIQYDEMIALAGKWTRNLFIVSVVTFFVILTFFSLVDAFKIAIAFPFIILLMWISFKSDFEKKTQEKLMPLLINFIGDFVYNMDPKSTDYQYLFKDTDIINHRDTIEITDDVSGRYNNLNVRCSELSVLNTDGGQDSRPTIDFKGFVIKTAMHKKFNSITLIKSNSYNITAFSDYKKVELEDPVFELNYNVYSNNQVEARYLLTTSVMEKFSQLKQKHGDVLAAFYKNEAYIFISTTKNMFAIPHGKKIMDITHYQNMLTDLAQMLSILDVLNIQSDTKL